LTPATVTLNAGNAAIVPVNLQHLLPSPGHFAWLCSLQSGQLALLMSWGALPWQSCAAAVAAAGTAGAAINALLTGATATARAIKPAKMMRQLTITHQPVERNAGTTTLPFVNTQPRNVMHHFVSTKT
jgi:hypothetical protein